MMHKLVNWLNKISLCQPRKGDSTQNYQLFVSTLSVKIYTHFTKSVLIYNLVQNLLEIQTGTRSRRKTCGQNSIVVARFIFT